MFHITLYTEYSVSIGWKAICGVSHDVIQTFHISSNFQNSDGNCYQETQDNTFTFT